MEAGGATKAKQGGTMNLGASTLPPLPKDNTDRNRTSPFAFTGNKFEFRMVGSSQSIARPNFVLNTIVAESLSQFADRLEKAKDFEAEVKALVKEMAREHKRIIFNGNNYSEEWVTEAEKRGLPNIRSTVEATQALTAPKNIRLLEKHGVLSQVEMESRCEIMLETYIKTIKIEALTMVEMAKRQILPAAVAYISELAGSIQGVKATGLDADTGAQAGIMKEVSAITASFQKNIALLESKALGSRRPARRHLQTGVRLPRLGLHPDGGFARRRGQAGRTRGRGPLAVSDLQRHAVQRLIHAARTADERSYGK